MLSIAVISVSAFVMAYLGVIPKWMAVVLIAVSISVFVFYVMLSNHMDEQTRDEFDWSDLEGCGMDTPLTQEIYDEQERDWDKVEKAISKDYEPPIERKDGNPYNLIFHKEGWDKARVADNNRKFWDWQTKHREESEQATKKP